MIYSIVKVIIWLFTIFLLGNVNNTSASLVEEGFHVIQTVDAPEKGCHIASTEFPVLPEAELLTSSTLMQYVQAYRLQRLQLVESIMLVKSILQDMANYIAVLTMHRESLYSTTISHYCQPSKLYYVFALRHIVI